MGSEMCIRDRNNPMDSGSSLYLFIDLFSRYNSHNLWHLLPRVDARLDIAFASSSPTLFLHSMIDFFLECPITVVTEG